MVRSAPGRDDPRVRSEIPLPVNPGETVVSRFASDGAAPVLRSMKAAPKARMVLNATLRRLEQLECTGTSCLLPQGGVELGGLPAGTTGGARAFNPVTEN